MFRRALAEDDRGGGAMAGAVCFVAGWAGFCCMCLYDDVILSIILAAFLAFALRLAAALPLWWLPEGLEYDVGESCSSTGEEIKFWNVLNWASVKIGSPNALKECFVEESCRCSQLKSVPRCLEALLLGCTLLPPEKFICGF